MHLPRTGKLMIVGSELGLHFVLGERPPRRGGP
jgi:hypothetical protein